MFYRNGLMTGFKAIKKAVYTLTLLSESLGHLIVVNFSGFYFINKKLVEPATDKVFERFRY